MSELERKTVYLDLRFYVAPRVGTVTAHGRAIRLARCGHTVYIDARGIDAITTRGKTLMCGECWKAIAAEGGADAGVIPEIV